jgi:hypothetical protein
MFESHREPLLPRPIFLRRVGRYAFAGFLLIMVSWLIGILGYRFFESMSWTDAMLNAAMILGGMGPVDTLHTEGGKIFAALYAMFSGVIFLISIGVLAAPIFHRVIHQFHIDADDEDDDNEKEQKPSHNQS